MENSTLPVASEMKETPTLAVKIDRTSLSSHTPVEKTSRDLRRISASTRKVRDARVKRDSHAKATMDSYLLHFSL